MEIRKKSSPIQCLLRSNAAVIDERNCINLRVATGESGVTNNLAERSVAAYSASVG